MLPIRLMGPLSRETGYAVGFRGMLKHLVEKDISIDLRPTKGVVPKETEQWILDLVGCRNYDRFGVAVGFPTLTDVLGTRRKVCYSMYESTDIPFGWKSNVAQAHEVWVPTTFCVKLFKPYNDNVRLVRWGIDDDVFKPGERTPHKGYVFGAVGVQSPRKGTDVMVRSFSRAFGGNPDVKLIIKTRDTRFLPPIDNEQIEVIDEEWSEERLVQFYRDIDCLVESSRGEGVGMPPLQAAFCGTPSIATLWGGPVDFADDKGVYGLRVKGLVPAKSMAQGSYWAEPDDRHLAQLMQWAVETRPGVSGDYSKWTSRNMANEFYQACVSSWRR